MRQLDIVEFNFKPIISKEEKGMRKRKRSALVLFLIITVSLTIGSTGSWADFYVIPVNRSPLAGPQKSLCDFPFGPDGNFEVKYDYRSYDQDFFPPSQHPNGGIKLEFWLGQFDSEAERDALAAKITKVIFINNDTGDYYEKTKADKYVYVLKPSGEYGLWLGHQSNVIGNWQVIAKADGVNYVASFSLTQAMLEKTPPIAVDPTVVSGAGGFTVSAPETNGDIYRFRIFNSSGDIIVNQDMNVAGGTASIAVDSMYAGNLARIETRFNSGDYWLALIPWGQPQSCNASGGNIGGGSARAITYFIVE